MTESTRKRLSTETGCCEHDIVIVEQDRKTSCTPSMSMTKNYIHWEYKDGLTWWDFLTAQVLGLWQLNNAVDFILAFHKCRCAIVDGWHQQQLGVSYCRFVVGSSVCSITRHQNFYQCKFWSRTYRGGRQTDFDPVLSRCRACKNITLETMTEGFWSAKFEPVKRTACIAIWISIPMVTGGWGKLIRFVHSLWRWLLRDLQKVVPICLLPKPADTQDDLLHKMNSFTRLEISLRE